MLLVTQQHVAELSDLPGCYIRQQGEADSCATSDRVDHHSNTAMDGMTHIYYGMYQPTVDNAVLVVTISTNCSAVSSARLPGWVPRERDSRAISNKVYTTTATSHAKAMTTEVCSSQDMLHVVTSKLQAYYHKCNVGDDQW
jgi:hypothetical protein